MQRIEEAFLSDVDEYCAEILIPALVDVEGGTANATIDAAVIVALADRLVASMRAADRRES
jgi:hypothetical protein